MSSPFSLARARRASRLGVLAFALAALPAAAQDFLGVVYPLRDLTLSVSTAGVVQRLHVNVGDAVTREQPLLQLEADLQLLELNRRKVVLEDKSELGSIEQRVEILDKLYADGKSLYDSAGSISREELMKLRIENLTAAGRRDQLRSEKRREQVEHKIAEQEYRLRQLRAPIDGVITAIEVDVGEWASPGEAVMRLVDTSVAELRINITQPAARKLATGGRIPVQVEDLSGSHSVEGKVIFVSPVADAASGLVEVRIRFANKDGRVRPGAKARISVGTDS